MRTYVVDAFTEVAFRGNPAGVVLLDAPAGVEWMQTVAAEMKHAETAFAVVGGPADGATPLRWFTPTTEVDLCGHATLATAHVLGGDQRFITRSGELTCTVAEDGWIGMDFPLDPAEPVRSPAELAAGLPDLTVEETARGAFDMLVHAGSADEVRAVKPDLDALACIRARGVIVTAPGDREGTDFVSRFFAPQSGIAEDPVTGSAHCTLASWWSARLDRTERGSTLTGEQLSPRGGVVRMTLREPRVELRGRAVTVFRGELLV